jgi:hypothetical protein
MSIAERLARTQSTDRIAEVRAHIQSKLIEDLGPKLYDSTVSEEDMQRMVEERLRDLLGDEGIALSSQERTLLGRQISDMVLGSAPSRTSSATTTSPRSW